MHIILITCIQLGIYTSLVRQNRCHILSTELVSSKQDEGRRIKVQALRDRTLMGIPEGDILRDFTRKLTNRIVSQDAICLKVGRDQPIRSRGISGDFLLNTCFSQLHFLFC
jgi:hypothetical protein